MTIADILLNHIIPFEIDDEKLKKLFSFFLHSAPTIESASAAIIPTNRLVDNWNTYISAFSPENHAVIAYHLDRTNVLLRRIQVSLWTDFICASIRNRFMPP